MNQIIYTYADSYVSEIYIEEKKKEEAPFAEGTFDVVDTFEHIVSEHAVKTRCRLACV